MPVGMEFISGSKEKSTIYLAVLTVAFIGISLMASTGQILQRQEQAGMEHLELTAMAILQAVDSSLRRGPMLGRGSLSTDTRDFFRDLEASGDILFVGIIDETGTRLTLDGENRPTLDLPEDARAALRSGSRWQGMAWYGSTKIYLATRRLQGRLLIPGSAPGTGPGMGPGMGMGMGQGAGQGQGMRHGEGVLRHRDNDVVPQIATPALFLTVAIDMRKHFAVYGGFKKTALLQTAYILAAAILLWVLAVRLLSRRKLARKAVLLEQLQARLIDNLPDGLLIADGAGRVTAANPAACAILAETRTEPEVRPEVRPGVQAGARSTPAPNLVGRYLADITKDMTPPVSPASDNGWLQTAGGGKDLEIRVLPVRLRGPEASPETSEDGTPSRMVIIRDRTRIRTLEKDLAEAEKLAVIGSLAAGVAHEIRNPLSALRGFAQYFAKKLAGKQPEEEYAQTMVREADRLNRVITDLLYLSRPRDLTPVAMDLSTVCGEMEGLLRFELREQGLSLGCTLAADRVNADPDALKQALLNLLLNALESLVLLPENGNAAERAITLSAAPGTEQGRPGVWITVTDTGPGMSAEERAQARTPFFTTKKKGTGLGLALVQTIMRGHQGDIRIESPAPGAASGCAVSLFFPDAPNTPDAPDASGTSAAAHTPTPATGAENADATTSDA